MPLFSVIMPVYNRATLVAQAIDSVLGQTFGDYELIVVDDGSIDDTPRVIASYVARHPNRVVALRQSNSGPGAARNAGIAKATGRYIAFLDSDDLWFPWTLASHARALQEHNFPALISGRWTPLNDINDPTTVTQANWNSMWYPHVFAAVGDAQIFGGTPGLAIETHSVRQAGGFPDQFINGEDQDLWVRLGCAPGYVQILNPPIYAHRAHAARISDNIDRSIAGARYFVQREKAGIYPGGHKYRAARLKIITGVLRSVCMQCLAKKHFGQAWWIYRTGFKWNWEMSRWRFLVGFWWLALVNAIKPTQRN